MKQFTNYYKRARTISSMAMVEVFAKKNFMDDKWEFYVMYEFTPKSDINKYNELSGKRITDIVELMSDKGMDTNVFNTKLEEIPIETVKFENDMWELIDVKTV